MNEESFVIFKFKSYAKLALSVSCPYNSVG